MLYWHGLLPHIAYELFHVFRIDCTYPLLNPNGTEHVLCVGKLVKPQFLEWLLLKMEQYYF